MTWGHPLCEFGQHKQKLQAFVAVSDMWVGSVVRVYAMTETIGISTGQCRSYADSLWACKHVREEGRDGDACLLVP